MRYETEAQPLLEFFEKVRGEGYTINIDQTGWHVRCVSEGILFTDAHLKKDVFSMYPEKVEVQKFTIDNHTKLLNFLKRFSGKIAVELSGKKIIIASERRQADISLGREEVGEAVEMPKKVDYNKIFKTKVDIVSEAIKNSALLKVPMFDFETKDGLFTITVKSATDKLVEKENVEFANAKSRYGSYITEIFTPLTGEIEIGFENNFPLIVKFQDKYSKFLYVLAPITE